MNNNLYAGMPINASSLDLPMKRIASKNCKEPIVRACLYLDEHGFADMEDWQIEEVYLAVFVYGRDKWEK